MGDLVQPVKEGKIQQSTSSSNTSATSKKASNNQLGKDAFLKLLVTQMQYQDPLNPSTNTEYVAQLATYSQLEELQNLSATATNSQAFGLVGKNVVIKSDDSNGETKYISGTVDFVNVSGGKTQISVNGSLYSIDKLDSIIDDNYIKKQNLPGVSEITNLKYDASKPENQSFTVSLGAGDTKADNVAVAIGENVIDSSLINVKDGKVTIDKSAFANLANGTYKLTVVFNDTSYTAVKDKVTLQVQNSTVPQSSTDAGTAENTATDSTTTDNTATGTN